MAYNLQLAVVSFLFPMEHTANERTGFPMTKNQVSLCTRLKRVGFTQGNQMKLYGQEFELVSEPIVMADKLILVDAIEKRTGRLRRIRIPLTSREHGECRA